MLVFLFLLYVLSWVHLEILAILFYGLIDFFAVRTGAFPFQSIEKKHRFSLVVIGVFSLIFSTPLLLLGIYSNTVLYYFDDMWHLALIREFAFRFPPHIPTYSGVPLTGYHFFYDFLLAKISEFFAISPFSLHFHLFSVFTAVLWGLGTYVLLFVWTKRRSTALVGVFLTMFGGNFAYLYYFAGHTQVSLADGLGIMQPAYSIYNPPFSLSIVFILFALIALYYFLQTRQKLYLILIVLAAGLLPMTKIYGAMVFFPGFVIVAAWDFLRKKFDSFIALLAIGVFFLATYGIFVGEQGGLIWFPLWAPIGILRSFSWYNFDNKIYVYTHQGVLHGLIETYAYGLFVFLILDLGTRILGILLLPITYFRQIIKRKPPSLFSLSVLIMLVISIFIPLFFIQTGKVFEIIQLGSYYLFFCSLFATLGFGILFSLRFRLAFIVQTILLVILFSFTICSSFVIYKGIFDNQQKRVSLDSPYYQALFFLQKRGTYMDTVLELPSHEIGANMSGLRYWYNNSSPIVTSFANKQTFLSSTGIDFKGMDTKTRMSDIIMVLQYRDDATNVNKSVATNVLKTNHIRFIFSPYAFDSLLQIPGVKKIYDRGYVIYQVG
jgi:hypothetical protein